MEDISKLQQTQLDNLRKMGAEIQATREQTGHSPVALQDLMQQKHEPKPKMRGSTNPTPIVDEVSAFWDKPEREELSPRAAFQKKVLGVAEEQVNRQMHRELQVAKRRAKARKARESRRKNRARR